MCQALPNAYATTSGITAKVSRIWSNRGSLAGSDPCVPVPAGEVYFSSVPVLSDVVRAKSFSGAIWPTKGVKIPAGSSKVVDVQLFSEAPTAGPWTVTAIDGSELFGGAPNLSFAWDATSGSNGDTLHLTITVNAVDATYNGELFVIQSELAGNSSWQVGIVGQ